MGSIPVGNIDILQQWSWKFIVAFFIGSMSSVGMWFFVSHSITEIGATKKANGHRDDKTIWAPDRDDYGVRLLGMPVQVDFPIA